MITPIIFVLFCAATIILITGFVIIIRNAVQIESAWKKRMKNICKENKKQIKKLHSGLQRNINSAIPSNIKTLNLNRKYRQSLN